MQASVSLMFQLLYDVLCDLPLPYRTQPLTNKELCVTHSFVLTTEHANTPLAIVVSAFLRSGEITCFLFGNLYKSFLDTWNCVRFSFSHPTFKKIILRTRHSSRMINTLLSSCEHVPRAYDLLPGNGDFEPCPGGMENLNRSFQVFLAE